MARFNLGQTVRVIEEAKREGREPEFTGRVGVVKRMHQVRPGGCVVDVQFGDEEYMPSFWEEWLEPAS